MNWKLIDSAPRDGTVVDVWAKCWRPSTDTFEFRRFSSCWWKLSYGTNEWVNVDKGWYPTHWMPIPPGP